MRSICVESTEELRNVLSGEGNVTVNLKKGVYETDEPLFIRHSNVTINGNGSVIKGSRKIHLSDVEITDGVAKIVLSEFGIQDSGKFGIGPLWCNGFPYERDAIGTINKDFVCGKNTRIYNDDTGPGMEVFYRNRKMSVTRYPEEGYMYVDEVVEKDGKVSIIPDDEQFTKMKYADKAMLCGCWKYDWAYQRHMIDGIDSKENSVEIQPPYHGYGYCNKEERGDGNGRFYAINVFEKLDKEGSWYIDRENGVLYVHVYEGQSEVELSVCGHLIYGENVQNISISDLQLCQCRKTGILFVNSENVTVSNSQVLNAGEWGIVSGDCKKMKISGCKIEHTGGGIYAEGGNRNTLESAEVVIENNEISYTSEWNQMYYAGVEICGVGMCVSGNKIHHLPHFAILLGGNNHIIEKNEIYKVCENSIDSGAVYMGRNLTFYGNIIRYNYLHDLNGYNGKGCAGLYFDDVCSSAEVYKNIFTNVYIAIQLGAGHDYRICDNMFYDCCFMVIDCRTENWYYEGFDELVEKLKKSDYKNDAWKKGIS